ncbi:hypothetical protein F2P81_020859 [Scophthalmus maximus]|uniref:Uncharacterized protein n=1 Tax=Scophthalmus maximus TaxID=52904 RepID=A0A6A4S462_SCOMX|nr:hypothetical protein F2P81_020859 [Scophthalmus maximus]
MGRAGHLLRILMWPEAFGICGEERDCCKNPRLGSRTMIPIPMIAFTQFQIGFLGQLLKWDSSVASHFDKHVSRCAAATTHHRSDMGHYGLGLLTFLKCSLPYCPDTIPLSVHSHCCKQTREAVIMPKPNTKAALCLPARTPKVRPDMSTGGEDAEAGLMVGQDMQMMQQNVQ